MSTQDILQAFDRLSLDEKLVLLDALWVQVVPAESGAAWTAGDSRALNERLADIAADPRPARPLVDVTDSLGHRTP